MNNQQLAAQSIKGNGSALSPYELPTLCTLNPLFPLFGEMNDFAFPVFSSYQITNTTACVLIQQYNLPIMDGIFNDTESTYHLILPIVLYKTSNILMFDVSIENLPVQAPNSGGFFYSMLDIYVSSDVQLYSLSIRCTQFPLFVYDSKSVSLLHSSVSYNPVDSPFTILSCQSSFSIGSSSIYKSVVLSCSGYLNLTGVRATYSCILSESGYLNYFGASYCYSHLLLYNSAGMITGLKTCYSTVSLQNSSVVENTLCMGHSNVFLNCSVITLKNSVSFSDNYHLNGSTLFAQNQNILGGSIIGLYDSNLSFSNTVLEATCLQAKYSTVSYVGGAINDNSQVVLLNSTSTIESTNVDYSLLAVEFGSILLVNTSFNTGSSNSDSWQVALVYTHSELIGDEFTTSLFYSSDCSPSGLSLNSITILGGINAIENSIFYSVYSNSGSSVVIFSGNNTITGNMFESSHDGLEHNMDGAGSALITYGGNNLVSGNSFITLSPQAQSLYIKDGDNSTQAGNTYLYNVNFTENGLPTGTDWSVVINGQTYQSSGNYINVLLAPNSYTYTTSATGYGSISGSVVVSSSPVVEQISFAKLPVYSVTFVESGLPQLTNWTVTFNGQTLTTTTTSLTFTGVNPGTYTYTTGSFSKYYGPSSTSGSVSINSNTTESVNFVGVSYTVSFHESGLNSNSNWTVIVNGKTYSSNGLSSINVAMPIGASVSYTINNETGYVSSVKDGNLRMSGNYTVAVQFVKSGISPTLTYVGIAVAAIVGIVVGGAAAIFIPRFMAKKPTQ